MKKASGLVSKWFVKASAIFIVTLCFLISACKEVITDPTDDILGEYETDFRTYTFPQSCPNGSSMLDVGSIFTIKKSINSNDKIEVYFYSTRKPIWIGQVKKDSLLFPKQIVATTNPDYPPGANEIKGFGLIKGNEIIFTIEELYTSNGYRHTCTFSAKKK